mgnify:CR=1 FL=1
MPTLEHPNYKRAEEKAAQVLAKFDIAEPVIPVQEIAQREGLTIVYFPPNTETSKKVSGFFDPKTKTIYVNSDDPPARQSFTIAHELGHFELDHSPDKYNVLPRFASPIDKDPTEQEANCFAANLLVPNDMLQKIINRYNLTKQDTTLLADLFGVSTDVIKYRLKWM